MHEDQEWVDESNMECTLQRSMLHEVQQVAEVIPCRYGTVAITSHWRALVYYCLINKFTKFPKLKPTIGYVFTLIELYDIDNKCNQTSHILVTLISVTLEGNFITFWDL